MTIDDIKEIEELYEIKLSKYDKETLCDELDLILYEEAVKEVACASYFNGGRRVRK